MSRVGSRLHRRASRRLDHQTGRDFPALVDRSRLCLVDVGAAGRIEPRWARVSGSLDYVGFEPDDRSRATLLADDQGCASYQILDTVLGETAGDMTLHLCRKPMASSTFEPNAAFVSRFPDASRFDVMSSTRVRSSRLDALDLPGCDFIKVDVQGAELAVLRGAGGLLDSCLGVEAEVEFLPIYAGQPLFGDVSGYLAGFGLEFVDFVSLNRWRRDRFDGLGQLVSGDALFLRAPEDAAFADAPAEMVNRYVGICALYHRYDLVQRLRDDHARVVLRADQLDALSRLEHRFQRARRPAAAAQSWIQASAAGETAVHLTY